jgi:tetratricopeptide (TPR) repeat protein
VLYDDDLYVTDNDFVRQGWSAAGLRAAFATPVAGLWHPLTLLSHMLDVELFGLDPAGHHASSVLVHLGNVLLLFALLARTTAAPWRSAFVAACFALHPLQVESVAWVAERKNLLCTLFGLLACHAYVGWCRWRGTLRYALVVLLYALGLLAKPMLVTLPFALLLLDYWPLDRLRGSGAAPDPARLRARAIEKLPLFTLAALASAVTLATQAPVLASLETLGPGQRVAHAVASYGLYALRFVWPADLAVFYAHPQQALPAAWVAASGLGLALVTAWTLAGAARAPARAVGWLWYLGTLVPVIGLVQVGAQGSADRYAYLPLIGLAIVVAWTPPERSPPLARRALGLGTLACLAALALTSCATLRHWRDSVSLFERALAVSQRDWLPRPESPILHANLALAYAGQGRDAEALPHYRRALALGDARPRTHYQLGNALLRLGRGEEAIAAYGRALAGDPSLLDARANLAAALAEAGRHAAAARELEAYVAVRPDDGPARVRLADALSRSGRAREALERLEAGLAARPEDRVLANNLAWLLATCADAELRDGPRALRIAEGLRAAGMRDAASLDTLAAAQAATGRFGEAAETARSAAALAAERGSVRLAAEIRERMQLYAARRAYVQPIPPE